MRDNPFFSIIIPTFNQSIFLEKAIKSVLLQKQNYEIIIIDNNSTDNTDEVVNKYKNHNLQYLKIKNFGIIGKSRNLGIQNSRAPWVAFLDSDDEWYEDKLSYLEEFIKKNPYFDVITNDEEIFYEGSKKKIVWKYGPYTKDFYKKLIIDGNCVSTSASVVKKKFLFEKKILFSEEESFASVEDYDFFLNLALNQAKFKFIHKILGKHFFHKNSFSRNFDRHHKAAEVLLDHHINNVQKFTKSKKKLLKKVNTNLSIIKFLNEIKFNKNYFKAFLILAKDFIKNPLYLIFCLIKKIMQKFKT